jgi:hypothetical protein
MSSVAGTLENIAIEFSKLVQPLQTELSTPGQARVFLAQMGFTLTDAQTTGIAAPLSAAARDAEGLVTTIEALLAAINASDDGALAAKSIEAIQKIAGLIGDISTLGSNIGGLVSVSAGDVAQRIFDYLLFNYLGRSPEVNDVLQLLGLLERADHNQDSTDPNNPPYTVATYRFDHIGGWFSDPAGQVKSLYDWGQNAFDGSKLFSMLETILARNGLPVILDDSDATPRLDIVFAELLPKTDVTPPGLLLRIKNTISSGLQTLPVGNDASLEFKIDFQLPNNTGVSITPDGGFGLVPPAPGSTFSGDFLFKVIVQQTAPPGPFILFGEAGGSRLEIGQFTLTTGATVTWDGSKASGDFLIEGDAEQLKVFVDTSSGDGFLNKILPDTKINADFSIKMGVSSKSGFYFSGSSTLQIQLPTHIELGPISIDALTLTAGLDSGKIPVSIGADLKAVLGPLTAVVQNVGVTATLSFPPGNSGNLGPLQFDIGFKPPNGVGLSIDADVVSGGGFLFLDPAKGEYAGVAELSIADVVTVKAIALITTKMPDGSNGFSLLLILTTDFPPIQLGFGFTLNGIGGLLGLNRSAQLDVLRDGVRTGAVDDIMFPTDIIANAPRIISDLKTAFPPQENVFLVGPMAKFGWGTPSLITLSIGIIVEIPPGNIAILGVLRVALPTEDEALILIQVAFIGILDFDEQLLSFDASLYESHILFMTLEGDMAVRLKWGDNAGFLLSVGGFHPAFHPPDGLHLPASMKRLSISILDYDWAKIKVDCYFAVTSNTVQFGAHLYLFFGVDSANITGQLGLDVLFQFSPFYFIAQLSGSLSIAVFGMDLLSISLNFSLEGPTPWRAKGTGSLSILFFSIDVSFDVTWGETKNTSLPPVDVMPIFLAEINKQQNWKALPPPSTNLLVTLRAVDPSLLVLHPFGSLTLSQRALPLNLTLDKVGSQKPDDVNRVDITAVASNGTPLPLSEEDEQFAMAQYQDMSDSDKLSRPSYQDLKGGVTIGSSDSMQSSKMTRRTINYSITIIDKEPQQPLPRGKFYPAISGLFHPFLTGSAAAKSPLSYQRKTQLQPFSDKIAVSQEGYAVSNTSDNKAVNASSTFTSEAMARDALNTQVAANPSLAGAVHVLPNSEVNAS